MAKRIITTLLAAQFFVTAGLCGGVCCGAREGSEFEAAQDEIQKPDSEVKSESGHCPLHAAKATKRSQPEHAAQTSNSVRHTIATHHQKLHQASSSSAIKTHFCACDVEREKRSFDALLQRGPEQRWSVQSHPFAIHKPHWLIDHSASPPVSTDFFHSHSPPFDGRRLNLRI